MIADFIAFLVATFLLSPLQATMEETLAAAGAPAAIVRQVEGCATGALPALAERAVAEPVWALRTAFGAWIGTTSPEAVLREASPECRTALAAARPFLAG